MRFRNGILHILRRPKVNDPEDLPPDANTYRPGDDVTCFLTTKVAMSPPKETTSRPRTRNRSDFGDDVTVAYQQQVSYAG